MPVDLSTTNLMLGILAAVSVIQLLALAAAAFMGYRLYSTAMETIREVEQRHVVPLVARANDILADVKGISARVNEQTERVDHAIRGTINRVDETAARVKGSVGWQIDRAAGILRSVRAAIEALLTTRHPKTA